MPKILLLGKDGQIGWELAHRLATIGQVVALGRVELDLSQLDAVGKRVQREKPDVIVNAAAYADVDGAEAELDLARAINTDVPRILAKAAKDQGSLLIHYSTDYVFSGEKDRPYTEDDRAQPVNRYGRTKLDGEQAIAEVGGAHWIFRTSWVYSTRRPCFVTKVLDWARTQESLRVVDDQFGSPTWCRSLAEATVRAIEVSLARGPEWTSASSGLYHAACQGSPSRLEWAQAIIAHDDHPEEQVLKEIVGVPSSAFSSPAKRPRFSALDSSRFEATFGVGLPLWNHALVEAMRSR